MIPIVKRSIKKYQIKGSSFLTKFQKGMFSFPCLNLAQFLGVLNDNIYKFLVIFFLLSVLGIKESGFILSTAAALYVIPFLLFSSAAGILADRFSKQRLIQILKGSEILIMAAALWAFHAKSTSGCYVLLFLLATHSAIFGPPKYGILPEIVEKTHLPKANGHITAFTYLAMIIGTFLASFFTEISHGNFMIGVSFCLLFSIFGFLSSLGIQKVVVEKTSKVPTFFFTKEILQTMKECKFIPLLLPSIFGSAYLLFIGAFTQLNVIPLAIDSLQLSEYAGGYLFLVTAIGIAVGSFLCGKLLKKKPSLGLSCLSGLIIGILFILIAACHSFLLPIVILLALLGLFGGAFIISFDTFIQINSPEGKRGQTIAAANFLSFVGVLVASAYLYISGTVLGLSAATSFFYMGLITLISVGFISLHLSEVFLPFFAKLLFRYKKISIVDPLQSLKHGSIFILEEGKASLFWSLYRHFQRSHLILFSEKNTYFLKLLSKVPSIHFLSTDTSLGKALELAKSLQKEEDLSICIILNKPFEKDSYKGSSSFFFFKEESIYLATLHKQQETSISIHPI